MSFIKQLSQPSIMGILNCSPDSFYQSSVVKLDKALSVAETMCQHGADIIDIGGESTRPGAENISLQEELDRVIPAIEMIKKELEIFVSIDTSKPQLMKEAIRLGVDMINDVNALQAVGAIQIVQPSSVAVCLMHKKGAPQTMQQAPKYTDVVKEVNFFLENRVNACVDQGIERSRLCIDPGFGFGKTLQHNKQLLKELKQFTLQGLPLLVGLSRKSMVGELLGQCIENRLYGSLGLAIFALMNGANIIRTHDVEATQQISCVMKQIINYG